MKSSQPKRLKANKSKENSMKNLFILSSQPKRLKANKSF